MATILLSLGKQVTMVMDKRALGMNKDIIAEAVQKGEEQFDNKIKKKVTPLMPFPFISHGDILYK